MPLPLPGHHAARSLPPHRRKRPVRWVSVWPVAKEDHDEARDIPGWLLNAIVTIVVLYTERGQRVLLLAPPANSGENTAPWATHSGQESGSGLLTGLIDAAQTAARLGRTIHARAAQPACSPCSGAAVGPIGRESGHRFLRQSAGQSADPAPTPADPTGGTSPTALGPGRFHAVITVVDPRAADWVPGTPWGDFLAPDGTLAFITHSDYDEGQLIDLGSLLADTTHRAGLAGIDHVALLEVPIRRSTLTAPPNAGTAPRGRPGKAATGPRHERVHSDLYLYAPALSGTGNQAGEEG